MSTTAHALTFEVPTTRDYLNGGFGDLIAQCSCGTYEYVSSRTEGAYWHGLHRANLHVTRLGLLRLLVDNPMPGGWEPEPKQAPAAPVRHPAAPRAYTCPSCIGAGSIEMYGPLGGRFYNNERATCPDCSGSGHTERWVA